MSRKSFLNALKPLFCVSLVAAPVLVAQAQETTNVVPAPTGEYSVGVSWRHWIDESRDESFFGAPDEKREMMVQILYPASVTEEAEPAVYMPNHDIVLPTFAAALDGAGITTGLGVTEITNFQSHAFLDAPLSEDQEAYPVLIFSHGGAADVTMYTAQLEELASHGYIVVAINHPYGAAASVFPDERVVIVDFSQGLEASVPHWSQDQIFAMDQMEALNEEDPEGMFTGHLDLDRLGVFGHSLGGAAATMTCQADARCKAGANEDGPVYGDVIEKGLDQPFLYMLSDSRFNYNADLLKELRGPLYEVAIKGFEHLNFGDFVLWTNKTALMDVKWLSDTEAQRSIELTRHVLVSFFDKFVKGTGHDLKDTSDYPELTVTIHNEEPES